MLTAKQNLLEVMKKDGNPDRFVKQYEFLNILVPDTYYMGNYPFIPGSPDGVDQFGVTWTLPVGQMGAYPLHDDEHRVLKDITQWREILHKPYIPDDPGYWGMLNGIAAQADRENQYVCAVQTQGIFELDTFKRFMEMVDKAGIKTHIMAGIIPLKAAGMAKFMNANVPGIDVPQHMIDRLAAAAAEGKEKGIKGLPAKVGMEMAAEMIAKIKDEKLCDGVHIMAIGAEKNVPKILDMAGLSI